MNYFELYELPISLQIDQGRLRKKFFKLSKQYHPDRFVHDDEEEQSIALEQSSMINEAYETLKSFDKTLAYILTITNIIGQGKESMNNMFLFEMMEINESLDILDKQFNQSQLDKIIANIDIKTQNLRTDIESIVTLEQINIKDKISLEKLKSFYLKMKYILRIKEKILTFAIQ